MPEEKQAKTRNRLPPDYFVQESADGKSWQLASTAANGKTEQAVSMTTTIEGEKWVRKNGKEGHHYRVCRVTSPAMRLETITKSVLRRG